MRNQVLENIQSGLVVIGGLNRAGKTTLLQILRYLGYGFPQAAKLPPPTSKYEVEADLETDTNLYNLRLSGYGEPVLKRVWGAGKEPGNDNITKLFPVDMFTYSQLFTLTLAELSDVRALPRGEQQRLQALLLGAGLKEILLLPQLRQEFFSDAEKIGGRRGSPHVKQFKPHAQRIRAGQNQKRIGLSQIDDYAKKQEKLLSLMQNIEDLEKELAELKYGVIRLDVVKNNFGHYLELVALQDELRQKQGDALENPPSLEHLQWAKDLWGNFVTSKRSIQKLEVELVLASETVELLLESGEQLEKLWANLSGVQEKLRQYGEEKENYQLKEQALKKMIGETNAQWSMAHQDLIKTLRTDTIVHNELIELVEQFRSLQPELKNSASQLARLLAEKKALEKDTPRRGIRLRRFSFFLSLALVILGLILARYHPNVGLLLGGVGALGVALFNLRQIQNFGGKDPFLRLGAAIEVQEEELAQIEEKLSNITAELSSYRTALGLPSQIHLGILPSYLLSVRELQGKIRELEFLRLRLEESAMDLAQAEAEYGQFLTQFDLHSVGEEMDWDIIANALRKWRLVLGQAKDLALQRKKLEIERAELLAIMGRAQSSSVENQLGIELEAYVKRGYRALDYQKLQSRKVEVLRSIESSLSSDAVRIAFCSKDVSVLSAFCRECQFFARAEEAESAHEEALLWQEEKRKQLELTREESLKLEAKLVSLASAENLLLGQREIDGARGRLRMLAEEYAVAMLAAFLLQKTEERVLQNMKDTIMEQAGSIFQKMTGGEYKGILPPESLLDSGFQALLQKKAPAQTMEMLSRGTQEQLYLAVRLSKIMEIKPPLPVIIDDSLANFDRFHLGQTLQIFANLAQTHQVFVLTCHDRLVEELAGLETPIQYWKLKNGNFSNITSDGLIAHLREGGF